MTQLLLAVLAGFAVAVLGTPAGVSGAVFLLPLESSLLGVHGPSVSATNLLYNTLSTPLSLRRLCRGDARRRRGRRRGERGGREAGPAGGLLALVAAVCVPAAVLGAYARVTVMADPARFRLLMILVLLPLGLSLLRRAVGAPKAPAGDPAPASPYAATGSALWLLGALAFAAGCAGGVLGIGGGSLLAPALVALSRRPVSAVTPLALTATLATSLTGLAAYSALDAADIGTAPAAPYWDIGLALGAGGLAGGLTGVRLQSRVGERALLVLLGTLATATALSYAVRV